MVCLGVEKVAPSLGMWTAYRGFQVMVVITNNSASLGNRKIHIKGIINQQRIKLITNTRSCQVLSGLRAVTLTSVGKHSGPILSAK